VEHCLQKYEECPTIEQHPDPFVKFEDTVEYRQIKAELLRLSDRITDINQRKVDDLDLEERVKK
jgi:hypothetical protein